MFGDEIKNLVCIGDCNLHWRGCPTRLGASSAHVLKGPANSLDPAKIVMNYEYQLIQNLFSTLVEYDIKGRLVSGIPESFTTTETTEDTVTFKSVAGL